MESEIENITFGPVPSRRLGRSLGINNIPPKICTYSCVYCQLGRTLYMRLERGAFYEPDKILRDAEDKVRQARSRGEAVDYLTFVPDGEATLDIHLGQEIKVLKKLGFKIAVITNSSLIGKEDVRDEVAQADWVSLKIDALSQDVWRRMNRPHGSLRLGPVLNGVSEFARAYKGALATETMLVQGVNDNREEIEKISDFVARIKPTRSYLAVPIRPPAEKWVKPPTEWSINMAYQTFKEKEIDTEYLIRYEGTAFAFTGNVEKDLLSITSVHPMRDDAVHEFLKKAGVDWIVIEKLVEENKLIEAKYKDKIFYVRRLMDC